MPAHDAERWIAEALRSVLGQTLPPAEIIVVDDGSTDRTADVVAAFGDRVRLVRQRRGGAPAAFNRAFAAAAGDYVAMCPADDLWEPRKLEWQVAALRERPEIDVTFGHMKLFGTTEGDYARPPSSGMLEGPAFRRAMFEANLVTTTTALVRRSLHDALGGFREDLPGEDYEFWMRALRCGARFHYDPRLLGLYRRHDANLSSQRLAMTEMSHLVHRWYAADLGDRRYVRGRLARDLCAIGRHRLDSGMLPDAARAYRASLRQRPSVRGMAWSLALAAPGVRDGAARLDRWRRR